jgi:hypothetical protein
MKLAMNWMSFFYEFDAYKIGIEFNDQFNKQLQSEFELLTGQKFDGKNYFLRIVSLDEFSYYPEAPVPYGKLESVLLFYEKRMDVSIVWYDKVSKKLFKPGDNIAGFDVEFHWENFDVLHPALSEVILKQTDIRQKYDLNVSFPVFAKVISFDTDYTLKIPSLSAMDATIIERALADIQEAWNAGNTKELSLKQKVEGLIHSIEFIGYDEDNKALFEIDSGSAGFEAIKFILQTIDKIYPGIQKVEIFNN